MDRFPPDPEACTAAREHAEALGDDAALLRMRDLELAAQKLPPVIDGARLGRLLGADPIATTWEAWDLTAGHRVVLRCLRPRWRRDPVMHRRMAQAVRGPLAPQWCPEGDWPHLRQAAPGPLLLDRLPVEDVPDSGFMARVLIGGLLDLEQLHEAGLVHGCSLASHLYEGPERVHLLWLDTFGIDASPRDDLAALGQLAADLDPGQDTTLGQLAAEWTMDPPPTARDAGQLLVRSLGSHLLTKRHGLVLHARNTRKRAGRVRLLDQVRRLHTVLAPPAARACVRASHEGVLVLIESDGVVVRGGGAAMAPASRLPIVFSPSQGLDAQASRTLLRAWAMRSSGDEDQRQQVQASLRADDHQAELLIRWLSAMARLRAAGLLLEAAGGPMAAVG